MLLLELYLVLMELLVVPLIVVLLLELYLVVLL
jgi:hypothetical protein